MGEWSAERINLRVQALGAWAADGFSGTLDFTHGAAGFEEIAWRRTGQFLTRPPRAGTHRRAFHAERQPHGHTNGPAGSVLVIVAPHFGQVMDAVNLWVQGRGLNLPHQRRGR